MATGRSPKLRSQKQRPTNLFRSTAPHAFLMTSALGMLAFLAATNTSNVFAQASVLPRGFGSVSFSYQTIGHTGRLQTDGTIVRDSQSTNRDFVVGAEYGFTDRFTLFLGIPIVSSMYTGAIPVPPKPALFPADQCRCWNSGFQNFSFSARYNIVGHPHSALTVTPSVASIVPSHDYDYHGQAVLGRGLRELQFGVDASQRIDAISDNLFVQGYYRYAVVQKALDVGTNRSNAAVEVDLLLADKRLTLSGLATFQVTHGGLRFGSTTLGSSLTPPGEFKSPELFDQRNRLQRDIYQRAGAGVMYSFQRMSVFGNFFGVLGGKDTHIVNAVTVGVIIPFQLGRSFLN